MKQKKKKKKTKKKNKTKTKTNTIQQKDTFSNLTLITNSTIYPFSETGIVSDFEKQKFKQTTYQPDADGVYRNIVPPPDWSSYGG